MKFHKYPIEKFTVFVSLLSIERQCLGSPLVGFSINEKNRAASRQNAFPENDGVFGWHRLGRLEGKNVPRHSMGLVYLPTFTL